MKRYFLGVFALASLGLGCLGMANANEQQSRDVKQVEIQQPEKVKWIEPNILKKLQGIKPAKFDMLPLNIAFGGLADGGNDVKSWSDGAVFESAVKTNVDGMLERFHNGQPANLNGFKGDESITIFSAKRSDGVSLSVAATSDGKVIARKLSGPKELIVSPSVMQAHPNEVYRN
jgi:hypothetical protein